MPPRSTVRRCGSARSAGLPLEACTRSQRHTRLWCCPIVRGTVSSNTQARRDAPNMAANRARRSRLPVERQCLGARCRSARGWSLDAGLCANSRTNGKTGCSRRRCGRCGGQPVGAAEHRHLSAFALVVDPRAEHDAGRAIWRSRHDASGHLNPARGIDRTRPKPASHGLRWSHAGRQHAHGKKPNQRALHRWRETLGLANAYE